MGRSIFNFNPERKLPPSFVFLILIALNFLYLYWIEGAGWLWPDLDRALSYFLVIFTYAVVGIILDFLNTLLGRWYIYLGLTGLILLTTTWWKFPEFSTLVVLPIALVAAMIGLRASTVSTILTSVLLIGFHHSIIPEVNQQIINTTLLYCWLTLATLFAIILPLRRSINLYRDQLFQANQFLVDARARKAELEQALESLANANRQLALANKKMAVLSEIAEDAQKAKTAFVANVSHEFRTPLNMITGLIDLMLRNPENYDVILSPKMKEDFHVIYRNCEHLSNMVNDVLDLTRVETGRLVLYREWVNLNEIIDKAVTVVRPLMEKKQLALKMEILDELPLIYCDRMRIQQVVLNLLSNAARFTDHGEIRLVAHYKNQAVSIEVTDTGPGIQQEDRERIFEPFWQGHDPIWQKKGGSGIGLSLSREFINLHGGHMWFESVIGVGSSFFFSIPVSPLIDPISKPGHFIKDDWLWRENAFLSAQAGSTENIVKPRVILYDQTETLSSRFIRYSDQVEFANIQEISQVAREGSARAFIINAASLDNAWTLIEGALNNAATTPIIGCSVPGEYRRALDLGAKGYLIKPIKIDDLKRVVNSVNKPLQRVLIVDDDIEVLTLYKRMIESFYPELEVTTASCGEEALETIHFNPPDLMFLDVIMPEMNGWQVLEILSQDFGNQLFPIYFITAQDPVDQLASSFILATIKGGIPLGKLLRGSLEIASLLMASEKEPDPMSAQISQN
jgi:signal transduction histidine kinase/CheY-like chemotaxis protein